VGITEVKQHVGHVCIIRCTDRTGTEVHCVSMIHDVTYVPLYGGYLIVDTDDIRLDRVTGIEAALPAEQPIAA